MRGDPHARIEICPQVLSGAPLGEVRNSLPGNWLHDRGTSASAMYCPTPCTIAATCTACARHSLGDRMLQPFTRVR